MDPQANRGTPRVTARRCIGGKRACYVFWSRSGFGGRCLVFVSLLISGYLFRTVADELNEENTMAVLGAASAAAGGTWSVYLWLREVES